MESGFVTSRHLEYQEFIPRFRELLQSCLPVDASVLVVSKGDSELLKLGGRKASHFPSAENGSYSGSYPPNSAAAIDQLELLRSQGASYLVFPISAFWWFDFYCDFKRYLDRHYPVAMQQEDLCVGYALQEQLIIKPCCNSTTTSACQKGNEPQLGDSNHDKRQELLQRLHSDPENARLMMDIALAEGANGESSAAEQYVDRALELGRADSQIHFDSARLAWLQSNPIKAEERLRRMLELFPNETRAKTELAKLYCSLIENRDATTDCEAVQRLVECVRASNKSQPFPPDLLLRIAECLGEAGETESALVSLQQALGHLDFHAAAIRAFVLRLVRPAVSDLAFIPLDEPRGLAAFLTHLGIGFAALHHSFQAGACYVLAAAAYPDSFAATFNLAFMALENGQPTMAMEYLRRVSRVSSEEAAQVCWPTQNGQAWPRGEFDLSAKFDALKPANVSWPTITVITPSYNQSEYIEETLLSVLKQHYPRLEYIVVDGGSMDGTVEILRRYEPSLTRLIIEPDEGQADAINKGLRLSTGELIAWINSDDLLGPGALYALALTHIQKQTDIVAGFCLEHSGRAFGPIHLPAVSDTSFNVERLGDIFGDWLKGHFFYQPEVAFSRRILDKVGKYLETQLKYTMDYEFWLRCAAAGAKVAVTHWPVGMFRRHAAQKTANMDDTIIEQGNVRERFVPREQDADQLSDIRLRMRNALSNRDVKIAVVSTQKARKLSPETAAELRSTFSRDGVQVEFHSEIADHLAEADLVILLVHHHQELVAVRRLREGGCKVPMVGWLWDNHRNVFDNHKAVADLDVCIPAHDFAHAYLRTQRVFMAPSLPQCVTQWTIEEARRLFEAFGRLDREGGLYGGLKPAKRDALVEQLIGSRSVTFIDDRNWPRYVSKSPEERFRELARHKVSLCLPDSGELTQQVFDALLTGQVPLVPSDVHDLDAVVPKSLQTVLPIVRFHAYTPEDVMQGHAEAARRFDEMGLAGVERRHQFALENHMFASRIQRIISYARELATWCDDDNPGN